MALRTIGAHNSSYRPASRIDLDAVMLGGGRGCSDADSVLFECLRLACTSGFPTGSVREETTVGQPGTGADSGGRPDSGGLRSRAPDLPNSHIDIQAALFPPEVGRPTVVPRQPAAAVGAAVVSAYAPPLAGAAGGEGSAPGGAADKTYAPASGGSASPWAPQGTSSHVSVASAAPNVVKCRPYWPAYSETGHIVSAVAGGLPIIRPSAPHPNPLPDTAAVPSAPPPPPATELHGKSWDVDAPTKPAPAADATSAGWGGTSAGSSHSSVHLKVSSLWLGRLLTFSTACLPGAASHVYCVST